MVVVGDEVAEVKISAVEGAFSAHYQLFFSPDWSFPCNKSGSQESSSH